MFLEVTEYRCPSKEALEISGFTITANSKPAPIPDSGLFSLVKSLHYGTSIEQFIDCISPHFATYHWGSFVCMQSCSGPVYARFCGATESKMAAGVNMRGKNRKKKKLNFRLPIKHKTPRAIRGLGGEKLQFPVKLCHCCS